jgi:uncharacterized membrane protein YeaQ/YmgE (transglycosylase-associated protein family)
MEGQSILVWIVVGLIAGYLASLVVGGVGLGLIGDIIIGVVGAFIGGWLFTTLAVNVPLEGLPGQVLVAFVGAVVLLFIIRLVRGPRRWRR